MQEPSVAIVGIVGRFLRTGNLDDPLKVWPGENWLARAKQVDAAWREALVSAVMDRAPNATAPAELAAMNVTAFARKKAEPMVRGLFPQIEQENVLTLLERSLVFLSPAMISGVLRKMPWPRTAWNLANLYLASYGAETLSRDELGIVGLSAETTCYVSVGYFHRVGRFEDFVVHEMAHIFHNCKRETAGLRETRRREWLLDIDYRKRETFAYACEAYSRILKIGGATEARQRHLEEIEEREMPPDELVDPGEYLDILREAVAARNGWKRILKRCSPSPRGDPCNAQ